MIETWQQQVYPSAEAQRAGFTLEDGTQFCLMSEQDQVFILTTEFTICERSKIDGNWYRASTQSIEGSMDPDAVLAHILIGLNLLTKSDDGDAADAIAAKAWRLARSEDDAARAIKPWWDVTAIAQINYEMNTEYPMSTTVPVTNPPTGGAPAASTMAIFQALLNRTKVVRGTDKKLAASTTSF